MTLAYLCILIAALLPYVWVVAAKTGAPRYDNRDPRGWIAAQRQPRVQRGYNAHLNAFEAFAAFAAAVLMAQLAGVAPATITGLAVAFVALRIGHGVAYLAGWPLIRSVVWFGALGCVLTLMVLAILGIDRG